MISGLRRKNEFSRRRFQPACWAVAVASSWCGPVSASASSLLHYTARLHGVPLMDITLCLGLDAKAYRTAIKVATLGMADWIAHARIEGWAGGKVDGATLIPGSYADHGRIFGEDQSAAIAYPEGEPVLQRISPDPGKTRLPIQQDGLHGAIDGLSAVALESLAVTRTGTCQGEAHVFDGRQLRRAATHTGGQDTLPPNPRSVFAGRAVRCETESVLLAGFLRAKPITAQIEPRHSRVWLAPVVAGGPAVPVRMMFDADALGDIVVDVDATSQAACPAGLEPPQGLN